jgi:hypothetical protein
MKAAIPLLGAVLAAFLLAGCATSHNHGFRTLQPLATPTPARIAVLPPVVNPDLRPDALEPESPWWQRWLLDGRGIVVTGANPEREIQDNLVATLDRAKVAARVFPASDAEDARRLGADRLLRGTVHDYRTVLLGGNRQYAWVVAAGPLLPQYWLRCLTLEARLDWEVTLEDASSGRILYRQRLPRRYSKTVRYALGHHFTDKMHNFLRYEAAPEYIGESLALPPVPAPPAAAGAESATAAATAINPDPAEPDLPLAPRPLPPPPR